MSKSWVSESVCDQIASVEGLAGNADHAGLSINNTLQYMMDKYVAAASRQLDISSSVLCDCGAGFGWLAFAFLLAGGKHAIIVEPHEKKLEAAREIAELLKLSDRCEFLCSSLQSVNLPDQSVDIFASIETLEHVGKGNIKAAVANIARVTKQVVILTAPNQLSPLVAHDAGIPFSHWLPISFRGPFCRLFGVKEVTFNHFPAPWHLKGLHKRFQPTARVLVFETFDAWLHHYPTYSPYAGGRWKRFPSIWLRLYLRLISAIFGRSAYWVCPNLANVWVVKRLQVNAG